MNYEDYTTRGEDQLISGLKEAAEGIEALLNSALEKAYEEGFVKGQKEGYTAGYEARAAE